MAKKKLSVLDTNYLFPRWCAIVGWCIFIVCAILLPFHKELPDLFSFTTINIWPQESQGLLVTKSNWWIEILISGLAISMLLVSFTRVKEEDEFTINLRLKSGAWALKLYTIVIVVGTLLIYGDIYMELMTVSFVVCFLIFIGKFQYELYKLKKEVEDEE